MDALPDHLDQALVTQLSPRLAAPAPGTWTVGKGWLWLLGGAAVATFGYSVYAFVVPPPALTAEEQAALTAKGVVWAAPCAAAPASSNDMTQSDGGWHPLGSDDLALQVLGPVRMARLMNVGWRFWRPKTSFDDCVDVGGQQVRMIGG